MDNRTICINKRQDNFFFPFFIIWDGLAISTILILYTGVLCFGIPFTLFMEKRSSRARLKFVIAGTIFGQITPFLAFAIDRTTQIYQIFGIEQLNEFSLFISIFAGSIHGAICVIIYHKIVYGSFKRS